jgi:hypothetical protein
LANPTPHPRTELSNLMRDEYLHRSPTVFEANAANVNVPARQLYNAGGSGATGPQSMLNVVGRYYHSVQLSGVAGADSFNIEASLDGATWNTVGSAITANGITQFTGLFAFLRANKTAGTGTASVITVLSMSP